MSSKPEKIQRSREEFGPYARALADMMGLKDWAIKIGDSPQQNCIASTYMPYGIRLAKIHLSADFLVETPEEQRSTLVHELLHPHFMPMDGVVCDALSDDQQKPYQRMFEYAIDAVAVAIAPLFPLPSEVLDRDDATEGAAESA